MKPIRYYKRNQIVYSEAPAVSQLVARRSFHYRLSVSSIHSTEGNPVYWIYQWIDSQEHGLGWNLVGITNTEKMRCVPINNDQIVHPRDYRFNT